MGNLLPKNRKLKQLEGEGRHVNDKKVYRLYREENLLVRTKRREKLAADNGFGSCRSWTFSAANVCPCIWDNRSRPRGHCNFRKNLIPKRSARDDYRG